MVYSLRVSLPSLGGLASAMFWGVSLATDNVLMSEAQAAEVRKQGKRLLILYLLFRQITASLGLISVAGQA